MKRGTATVTPADFAQALATERADGPASSGLRRPPAGPTPSGDGQADRPRQRRLRPPARGARPLPRGGPRARRRPRGGGQLRRLRAPAQGPGPADHERGGARGAGRRARTRGRGGGLRGGHRGARSSAAAPRRAGQGHGLYRGHRARSARRCSRPGAASPSPAIPRSTHARSHPIIVRRFGPSASERRTGACDDDRASRSSSSPRWATSIHALPVARALRRALPDAELSWLVEAREAAILREHPDLDRRHPRGHAPVAPARWRRRERRASGPICVGCARGCARAASTWRWTRRASSRAA